MDKKLIELNIRKLNDKLNKVINESLLKGDCKGELHDLYADYDYVKADTQIGLPIKLMLPIYNKQIGAIGEQIVRLEKQLSEVSSEH